MSNIEKIRQEIERRKEELEKDKYINIDAKACRHSELKFLERFIDSLPECEETAKIPTEKYEEELNEEIQGFIDEYGYERGEDKILIAIVARHFAEWQKEQMMNDAVKAEITVGRLPDDWSLAYNPDELHRALLKFKSEDKVKIIIVKQ